MQKKKLPRATNALAARIVAISTEQEPPDLSAITGAQIGNPPIVSEGPKKNPAAGALARLGGLKGGKARAGKLSPRKRKQIATKAASARRKVKKNREV
jgi:hypothetical protein